MPIREDGFRQNCYYHVFNRGAGRQRIFRDQENYRYLLRLIAKHSKEKRVGIVCYCLLPNHYHMILRQEGDEPISRFINYVFSAYTQAFNRREGRSGTLFQGRFKHIIVDRQEYFLHLMRYIHINAVKAGLAEKPEEWDFSDYRLWTASDRSMAAWASGYGNLLLAERSRRFGENWAFLPPPNIERSWRTI